MTTTIFSASPGTNSEVRAVLMDQTEVVPMVHARPKSKPLPLLTVRKYARAATLEAVSKQYEDGAYYVEVPSLRGVWAEGPDLEAARRELEDVVFEWALIKLDDGDDDIPRVGGIDLVKMSQH